MIKRTMYGRCGKDLLVAKKEPVSLNGTDSLEIILIELQFGCFFQIPLIY